MIIVKRDNTQTLPYELVELILNHFNKTTLITLFMSASKYNPIFALHIKCVIKSKENPLKKYICRIYSTIFHHKYNEKIHEYNINYLYFKNKKYKHNKNN